MNDFIKQLLKQSNEDETDYLKAKLKNFENITKTAGLNGKDIIREDENRLAKEIEESIEHEKKHT